MGIDWPATIVALGTLVTAIATLVTALRTHSGIRTQNGQTVGQVVDQVAQRSALNTPEHERTRAEQATAQQTPPIV